MSDNNQNKWYIKFLSLLKLEAVSSHGRVNLAGVMIITIFCLIYSASDSLRHLISSVEDVVKTIALREDIYHEYESASVIEAVIPIIIAFTLCLIFLGWHEHRKNKINKNVN